LQDCRIAELQEGSGGTMTCSNLPFCNPAILQSCN